MQKDERTLTSIECTVYDVSANKEMYGPGGSYSVFAGHDITYCLARTSLEPEDLDKPYNGMTKDEQERVNAFKERFNSKYPIVGTLKLISSL